MAIGNCDVNTSWFIKKESFAVKLVTIGYCMHRSCHSIVMMLPVRAIYFNTMKFNLALIPIKIGTQYNKLN